MSENKSNRYVTAADMHWIVQSFVHWKHVNLAHGLGTWFSFFFPKIWTKNASLGSKLQ